jgi:hypothetical protein
LFPSNILKNSNVKYDYIIAGSGCSGLSLLYKILQVPSLQNKSILVIDKDQKKTMIERGVFGKKILAHLSLLYTLDGIN